MKKYIKKMLISLINQSTQQHLVEIENLKLKVEALSERVNSYYTNRWNTIDCVADYLVGAELSGDYMEFGVFKGTTFKYSYKVMARLFPQMKFMAFDSFEGLPEIKGIDDNLGYKSSFFEGQFAFGLDEFISTLRESAVDLNRIETVQGWFDKSLTPETTRQHNVKKAAVVWIDCDLYESTVPVLNYITDKLEVGTVILFDDWRCYRNLPDFGQQKACREWLEKNKQIKLTGFLSFGFHGYSFTVKEC